MLKSWNDTVALINSGKLLHIAGAQALLRKLPKGNWIGGSSEYWAKNSNQPVSGEQLLVFELDFDTFCIKTYTENTIETFTDDTYSNGFSIVIIPAETKVLHAYAKNSPNYKDIFIKNVVGWIAGTKTEDPPVVVNGQTGEVLTNEAVILSVSLPEEKMATVKVVNIFTADENSPIIEFTEESFFTKTFLVNKKEEVIVDYAKEHNINLQLPFVAEYSGSEVNTSIVNIADDKVITFGAPLFKGITYRFAKPMGEYSKVFVERISNIEDKDCLFSCNCISNMLHGDLQKYDLGGFYGPYVYGEIAYQLVNQTLVYLQIV